MSESILTPVFLWTDLLIWFLFVLVIIGVFQIRRDPQKSQQWRFVFASKTAMATSLVLGFYFLIALADSVHFKVDTTGQTVNKTMVSGLDIMFSHLVNNTERTYSAPFALKEYSSSVVYNEDGSIAQTHLPLKHVVRGVEEGSIVGYVLKQSLWAVFISMIPVFIFAFMTLYFRFKALALSLPDNPHRLPWKTLFATFFVITFVFSWLYILSFDFHVLGTNKVGEDVFYQSLKSIRTGVILGGVTTLVMLPLALILGISAGYFKGWVDDIIQYTYTTLNSIPGVLLIAAAVLVMQSIMNTNADWFGSNEERANLRLLFLIFILGLTSWTGLCRLLRAETLKISQIDYVTAAKAFGLKPFTIIRRHIYPNLVHLILIAIVLDFSGLVLAEAVLSYVGVGVDPITPSWGNMINQARLEMAREPMVWWSLFSAFCFMFILVLSANLFADRVQWVLNPTNEK